MGIFKNTCPFLSEELEFYDRPTEVKVAVAISGSKAAKKCFKSFLET